ncbi:OmpH family outer membrane protein [Polaribacter aquimarinus]|uniref:Outer membrane chaperone Skp n=1 Tax=Polaribacter aquimarinus TaxID=2100726 RepID=A0A2U2J7Z8_9FLAO|nr:OmpH family outer membrane protein [Polaribacter aquimarinus]PWG04444.1 hypothetical protein DIS07_13650 [Polaribacter aquimarinus]
MKSKILFISLALASIVSFSQTKTGTVDSDYIVSIMPETKIVIKRAQLYGARLDSSFNKKVKEYQDKVTAFRKNEKTLGALAKKTTVTELQGLETDIKKYRENGTKLMQLKRDELMRPLYQKLSKAVQNVAVANGYTQILTVTGNQFAYADPKFDITDLVIKKLGITIPKPEKK